MRKYFVAICCIYLVGCGTNSSSTSFEVQSFISIDSIMRNQQDRLLGKEVRKVVKIDGILEEKMITIDSGFMDSEWNFLSEFDLNKPGFVGGIEILREGNNVRYQPKANQTYLLEFLEYQFNDQQEIQSVAGAFKDQKASMLYQSTRSFEFNFENELIVDYIISGYQKIVLKDTVLFEITGRVQ